MPELLISVAGPPDSSDRRERIRLADELRDELLRINVGDVQHPRAKVAPGTKGTAIEWAELIVSGIGSLPPIIEVIRSWLRRNQGSTVTLRIDGDELTMSDASSDERDKVLTAFLRRHGQ
jgi:Effector Associated Constant Component 1